MQSIRLGLVLFAMASTLCFGGASESEPAAWLERRWKGLQNPAPNMGCRDLFSFALNAAAAKWHPERIEEAFALAKQMQDRDEKNRTYGNFKWYWKDKAPDDLNAAEFCMHHAILTWMFYKENLSDTGRQQLEELITFGVEGVKRRGVKPAYTNIFLMHVWNEIAIGENTNRPDVAKQGYDDLSAFLQYTWRSGIHEFVSTTYYGVDLDILGLLARYAKNAKAKRNAETLLRYFWTDIAANWYEPCQRLGGAHSRDYDYLTGHGMLDLHLRAAGWLPAAGATPDIFRELCKWTPPPEIRAQFESHVPRTVCQRWGEKPWEAAVHYRGRNVAVGSSGASYCPEDKVLTINFSGGPKQVVGNFVMDGRGDPYGVNKSPTGGGHLKSHHLTPFVASVQRGPEVLLLAFDNATKKKEGNFEWDLPCLLAHLALPSDVAVWIGDQPAAAPEPDKEKPLDAGAPIFLRSGEVAVGIRYVLTAGSDGKPAPLKWVNDGTKYNAMRLTAVLSEQTPKARGTVALWVRAAEGLDDAAFTAFRKSFTTAKATVKLDGDHVDLSVAGIVGPLHLAANMAKNERLTREGGETAANDCLLNVNGMEIGREILKGAVEDLAKK